MTVDRISLLDGLIASKLFPPLLDPRTISRNSLMSRSLEGMPKGRVITLVAPAGSGKSSLMTQLHNRLAEYDIATSWLGLDAEDNDPATFARYFISSLHAFDPTFAREELTALGANPVRDYDAFFHHLESRLSLIDRPVGIFIDDFQNIDDEVILRFFDRFLKHLPRNVSLIIASRRQLPIKVARLSVSDGAIEISQEELNFDQDQADLFLRRYHQIELNAMELERLVGLTEGWPAGVQLIGLAFRRHHGPFDDLLQTFSGRDRDLTRYLAESVINSQPKEVQHFLFRTSVLRRMCPDLCVAIDAAPDVVRMLGEVSRANLFVIPLDREGRWFRYHHLFAEFLQHEFRRRDSKSYKDACLGAAQWCDANDDPAEAIRYALDAEDYERAANLISRHAMRTSLYRGDHYSVRSWMRRLPEDHHAHRPELLLAHAWSCAFSRDTEHAMRTTDFVMRELQADRWILEATERDRWMVWTRGVQAAACACADDIENCEERALMLLPRIPADEPFLIATLGNCLSYTYFAQRNFEKSREYAVLAHENGHRAGAAYLSSWGDFLNGLVDVELGELRAASRFLERLRRESAGLGLGQKGYVSGLSALLDSEISVQRGDFLGAAGQIEIGRAFKEIFGPVEPQLVAIRNEARLLAHHRKFDLAQNVLEEGQDAALREQHHRLHVLLLMEKLSLMLTAGRIEDAVKVARDARVLDTVRGGGSAMRDPLRLLDARLRLAQGECGAALQILTTLQYVRCLESKGTFFLSIAANRALAFWSLGKKSDAVRQLDRALSSAADEGNVFPILSVGNGLLPILEFMEQRRGNIEDQDVRSRIEIQKWLLSYLRGEAIGARPTEALCEGSALNRLGGGAELTDREIQLIKLLHSGLDNKSIANSLFLSISTVKWHLHNVYEKLQVKSRGEALAEARRQGIF